jgi:hypothetical protein
VVTPRRVPPGMSAFRSQVLLAAVANSAEGKSTLAAGAAVLSASVGLSLHAARLTAPKTKVAVRVRHNRCRFICYSFTTTLLRAI